MTEGALGRDGDGREARRCPHLLLKTLSHTVWPRQCDETRKSIRMGFAANSSAFGVKAIRQPERGRESITGASCTRKRTPLGPYRRPMPRVLGWS